MKNLRGPEAVAKGAKPAGSNAGSYMIQLDSVRAFAVAAVVLAHYTPITRYGEFGILGVQCFFVLSGFLITGILLRSRDLAEKGFQPRRYALRQFYIRRFLRIFPIYYLTLFVCVAANIGSARHALPWHLTYTTNFYLAFHPEKTVLNIFWSLSVEEQFYLIWPCVILFTPRRLLFPVIALAFCSSPVYRYACSLLEWNSNAKNTLLFGNIDSLSMGAILALGRHYGGRYRHIARAIAAIGLALGIPFFILTVAANASREFRQVFPITYSHLGFCFLFGGIVYATSEGLPSLAGKLLSLRPVLYVGKVSYAVYLFHGPLIDGAPKLFGALGLPYPASMYPAALLLTALTLGLAAASWHFFEKPINDLKRHFPYREPGASA